MFHTDLFNKFENNYRFYNDYKKYYYTFTFEN
jgi:hypothetical protein